MAAPPGVRWKIHWTRDKQDLFVEISSHDESFLLQRLLSPFESPVPKTIWGLRIYNTKAEAPARSGVFEIMAAEERPATMDATTRRFDRESAPMDYSAEAMKEAFGRRHLWIQDMLRNQSHSGFEAYDAQLDMTTSILAVDIGMAHQTKDDIDAFGARGTTGKILLSLTRNEATDLDARLRGVTEFLTEANVRKNAPEVLFPQYGVASFDRLDQAMRAKEAQEILDRKMRQANGLDIEWHGFGGSAIAIEQTARNTMIKWTDEDASSHRVKAILSIMGSEKTRVNDRMWGVYGYHLEEHGKNQVKHATRELLSYITNRKRARQDKDHQNIQHLMLNGHSMGGEIAFAIALDEDAFLPELLAEDYALDERLDIFYLLNTPVTSGAKQDRSAVPLLGGWGGFLLKLGANKLIPYSTMRAGELAGVVKLAHNKFFTPNARHLYELAAHMAQMHLDPLYVAQCVRDLNRAPDMRDLVNGNRAVLQKIIAQRRIAAVIAQSDIILNPEKQFVALFDLDIPVFSLPGEDHYLFEQHQKIIHTLQTKDVDLYKTIIADWLSGSSVQRMLRKPTPYLMEVQRALRQNASIEVYHPLLERVLSVRDPAHEWHLKRARMKLRKLIGRFFAENGWTFIAHKEVFPLQSAIEERFSANGDAQTILDSKPVSKIASIFSRYYALMSVIDHAPTTISDTFLTSTGLPIDTRPYQNGEKLPMETAMGVLLQRNLMHVMHHRNALSAMGMSEFAQEVMENSLRLPHKNWTEARTATQRLVDHLQLMIQHQESTPPDALALYRELAYHIADYLYEIQGRKVSEQV